MIVVPQFSLLSFLFRYFRVEKPDEEFLLKYGKPTHKPPADADVDSIDLYNGDITYFRTRNDNYLKFVREEGKGYKLIEENNRTV